MSRRELARLLGQRTRRDRQLCSLADLSRATGVALWLVGGYVRDAALGLPARDLDLVAGRGSTRFLRALERLWEVRAFRFRKRGVTTWRLVARGREIDIVDAARRGPEKDLGRRELTVNAIAYDLAGGRVIDPFGGLADLRAGRLRLPQPGAIDEDPLRALRLARFLAQFPRFRLARETRAAAVRAAPRVGRASPERVRDELDRMLQAAAPQRGLEAIADLGLLDRLLPELAPLRTCRAGAGRPDVWRHTLDALGESARATRLPAFRLTCDARSRRRVRWALLLHDIAKPETLALEESGRPTFHGHEVLGARRADALLRRLRLPARERRRIVRLVLQHLRPGHLADAGAPQRGLRRLVRDAAEDLPLLVLHAACDAKASGSPDAARRWRRLRSVLLRLLEMATARRAPLPRLVDGRDVMARLGLPPGPQVGAVLRRLRELQEEGAIRTREEALEIASRILGER